MGKHRKSHSASSIIFSYDMTEDQNLIREILPSVSLEKRESDDLPSPPTSPFPTADCSAVQTMQLTSDEVDTISQRITKAMQDAYRSKSSGFVDIVNLKTTTFKTSSRKNSGTKVTLITSFALTLDFNLK